MTEMGNKFLDAALQYIELGMSVVILGKHGKLPTTAHTPNGLKDCTNDPEIARKWWEVTPKCNVGVVCGEPSGGIVVIDVDTKKVDGYGNMREWEIEHGEMPETATCCTPTGGYHFYYRVNREVRPSVNEDLGIDIRGDGSLAVVPPSIHPDTETEYVWEFPPDEHEIAMADERVYEFIEYVRPKPANDGNGESFPKVDASEFREGGRNNQLYKMACGLMSQSWDDDAIIASIETYNSMSGNPLPKAEVDKLLRSALSLPKGKSDEFYKNELMPSGGQLRGIATSRFNHVTVADKLLTKYGACYLDGAPAVFDGLHYSIGWDAIERAVISLKPNATQKNRNEVRDYLRIMMPSESPAPSNYIAFRNGVLDVDTMELLTLTPEMRIPNVIPHDWNPDARSEILDRTMAKISCNNPFIEHNLFEFIGLCMMRDSKYGYSAILLGKPGDNASNGKSTYIKMIGNILGRENYSALDLGVVAKRFQALQIMGKLANLGDDIGNEFVRGNDLAVVKKIITGEDVYTDVKGTKGLTFRPYCTMIFSANEMPKLGDDSEGMMRRMFPIRFNAKFRDTDPDFDPDISSKLKSEECMEAAIVRGIAGLKRVMANRRPTPNDDSEDMVNQIRLDNSSLLQWMDDSGITREEMVGWTSGYAYERYKEWCDRGGARNPFGKYAFGKEVSSKLNLVTVVERRDGSTARVYAPRA